MLSPCSLSSLSRFVLTCSDQKKIHIGDDNPLTLIVKAQNQGEGAYEAELIVSIPPQADFIGVVRNSEVSKLPLKNQNALIGLLNINVLLPYLV